MHKCPSFLSSNEMILRHVFSTISHRVSKRRPVCSGNMPNNIVITGASLLFVSSFILSLANASQNHLLNKLSVWSELLFGVSTKLSQALKNMEAMTDDNCETIEIRVRTDITQEFQSQMWQVQGTERFSRRLSGAKNMRENHKEARAS